MTQIGRANARDRVEIRRVLSACGLPYEDVTSEKIEGFLVAWEEAAILGTIGLERLGDVALVRSLAVLPAARNRGIGNRLHDAIEDVARSLGVREVFALTTTIPTLLEAWGYERIARDRAPRCIRETEEFRVLCPDSAILMRKGVR